MSLRLRFCFCGTWAFALRCSTDDVAFAHAAKTASRYVSMSSSGSRYARSHAPGMPATQIS